MSNEQISRYAIYLGPALNTTSHDTWLFQLISSFVDINIRKLKSAKKQKENKTIYIVCTVLPVCLHVLQPSKHIFFMFVYIFAQ